MKTDHILIDVTTLVKEITRLRLAGLMNIVVAGGRGVGKEGFEQLQKLADILPGKVGATRAAVEAGWVSYDHKVGRTGQKISPDIYIAVGISGAVQHWAGLSGPKVVFAINNDPDAPIFQLADYGIVGDAREVLTAMIALLKT